MSRTALIVATVLALVLALAAFVLNRPTAAPAQGPLVEFDPASVTSLRITHPSGFTDAVIRTGDAWSVSRGDAAPWPVSATQVRAALRLLAALPTDKPADGPVGDAGSITIDAAGASSTLRISPRGLGGLVGVEAVVPGGAPRRALVPADVADMLFNPGPLAWRDPAVLGPLGPDVSRITLRGPAGAVTLARVQGRWALREPVAQPADEQAISRLVSRLAALRVEDFLDAGPPADTGVETPQAELTVESDFRDPADPTKVTTARRALAVGRSADLASRRLFARVEPGPGLPPRTVVLAAEPLAALTTDPAAYLAKRALTVPAAEIARLTVTPASGKLYELRRTLDGWERFAATDGPPTPLPRSDTLPDQLAALLAETPAEEATLATPAGAVLLARLDAATLAGTPLGSAELWAVPGDPPRVALRTAGATRIYPPQPSATLLAAFPKAP